ncbi:Heat shock protein 75 kDa, mitochondrial [Holothuria leucospilota]|uniref:Heat shock protein 75 kDa, mitochondrial n=1 Tax=Holothuria leucospilota TaxID=206669 RepID=A0A9Q1H0W7_HOLLE|nr:Heat shock protein 75 kDa, mitochondrial [Holothuria leucospilota]
MAAPLLNGMRIPRKILPLYSLKHKLHFSSFCPSVIRDDTYSRKRSTLKQKPIILGVRGIKNYLDGNYLSTWKSNLLTPEHLQLIRCYSDSSENKPSSESQEDTEISSTEETHNIITDSEKITGRHEKHEFQAETRMLLDIVAKSLYSENEVFIRELISNASDALEKFRYLQMTRDDLPQGQALEIHIAVDQEKNTFVIQDTGIGMTKRELIDNMGTIARSGSKAFVQQLKDRGNTANIDSSIIGQFGVGFYSAFMVGKEVEIFTRSQLPDSKAWHWKSDGSGAYELSEAEEVQPGTKIVIHLKKDCWKFGIESDVKDIILKHSNFVGVPVFLNGKKINTTQALWTAEPKQVTEDQHSEFFQFLSKNTYDKPRYILHYKADAPLSIRSLFYIPSRAPLPWEVSQQYESGIALYSRKILIQPKAEKIIPKWLRFVVGVVDSEDIPLNLSREMLQNSALIRKLQSVITSRFIRFLQDNAKRDPAKYDKFFDEYGIFLREGIVSSQDQVEKEDIAKLLRYESSALPPGQKTTLMEYGERMKAGERNIYYICAPSRELVEGSPYYEAFKKSDREVLFCYDDYDELSLLQLREFDRKLLRSVESEMAGNQGQQETAEESSGDESKLSESEGDALVTYLKDVLKDKLKDVTVTNRLGTHPAMINVAEMGAARHFMKTALKSRSEEEKVQLLQPILELNKSHPIIQKLHSLHTSDPVLAKLLAEQVYDNAMIAAGLVDDPRPMLNRLHSFMEKALEKC